MISTDPSSSSYRFHNASLMRSLRAKFTLRKQHRTGDNSPEIHQQQETSRGHSPPGPSSRHETDPGPPSQSPPVPSFPDGVEVLHDSPDATIDICFVHGLSGNRVSTWTAKGQSKPWPETLLAPKLSRARILTYGYDAYIVRKPVASTNGLIDHATNLLNDLTTDRARSNASSRPLVFVAHSLGGLVCKEAVLLSRNNPEPHLRGIFDYIKGIVFLGTPHRGSWMADWARIPASALGVVKSINKSLLKILETDDKYLQSVQDRFWSMVREQQQAGRDLEVTCFFEELPLSGLGKVVSKDSAILESYNAISIHANHRNMVKFSSVDDNGFKRLLGELIRWESQTRNSAISQPTRSIEEAQIEKPPNSYFNSYGPDNQLNAPGGTQIISKGSGNHFPGAKFSGPAYFGTKEHFDPLQECLKSPAFPEMDRRFNDIDPAAKGTCEWLLRHKMYTSWTCCDRGLLWIKGKPGSGKSTLLQYVLNHVMAIHNTGDGALILSFFIHGRGSELQKTPLGLFQSLLHQLSQVSDALSDLVATFQRRYETISKPGEKWQWHPRELQRFFESSLLNVLKTHPVWLFVDALDECGEENAVNLVEEFKSLLQRLPPSGLKQFHICFTCRHYPILDLDGGFEVCVENENRKDISTFVQDKLSSFRVRTSSTIPDLMTKRADGVFLWARLMVKQVLDLEREGIGLKQIEAKIRSVPQKLDDLYRELIRNMGPDSLKLIEWICFAMKPLSLDELRWAMIVETDCPHKSLHECLSAGDYPSNNAGMKRRLQTLSCGLAEVDSDRKIVQFIHQSVKDFFIEKGLSALNGSPSTAKPDFVVGIAHHRLARTCIRYLAMEEIGGLASGERDDMTSDDITLEFPFLHYSTTSWVAHTKQSDARRVPQEDLLEYFTGPSNTLVERWVCVYRVLERYSDDRPPEGTSLVHIMSRYGVIGALGTILERADRIGINIDGKDSGGRTPLWWAAAEGHEAVVRLLLDRGAHREAADEAGWTPLLWAAAEGHKAVVRLLLDRGAYIEAAHKGGQTPLLRAAGNGHDAVVRLLLDRGAYIDAADKGGEMSLLKAAGNGHEAVVQLLLDRGAHVDAADKGGRTPLLWAAAEGHKAAVQLLLDWGADIDAADKGDQTPLLWAAAEGHEAVVQLLLDRGAYVDAADKGGRTPLLWAAVKAHEAVMRLLQSNGAQPLSTTSP